MMDYKLSTMGVFQHEEAPKHPKRCKCLVETLKQVFSRCRTFGGKRLSTTTSLDHEEYEYRMSDFDEEQEVFISAVISQAMENKKHRPLRHSFSWVYSPATKELYFTRGTMSPQENVEKKSTDLEEEKQEEEFLSVKSCFSCCSSAELTFHSVKTSLSRCSSLNGVDEYLSKLHWRRSVIEEFCHCEGWPFGLCRRAILLPPLPKSPSESWLSRKLRPITKIP